jgi:hypothetical protein
MKCSTALVAVTVIALGVFAAPDAWAGRYGGQDAAQVRKQDAGRVRQQGLRKIKRAPAFFAMALSLLAFSRPLETRADDPVLRAQSQFQRWSPYRPNYERRTRPRAYVVPGWFGTAPSYHVERIARKAGFDPVVVRHPWAIAMARSTGAPIIAHSSGNIAALWGGVVPDADIGAPFDTGARVRIHGRWDGFSPPRPGDYVIERRGHFGVTGDYRAARHLRRALGY